MISSMDAADAVALGDAREHCQTGHDSAEHGVGAVEMRLGGVGDEELATARIGAGKRHAHRTRPVTRGIHLVPEHEAGAAPPVAARVPILRDEVGHDPMPARSVKVAPLDERKEGGHGERGLGREELNHEAPPVRLEDHAGWRPTLERWDGYDG